MAKRLSRIQSDDEAFNRFQDQILGALNPILKTLPDGIGTRPRVTGSTGGNVALESLLVALAGMGLITDETT